MDYLLFPESRGETVSDLSESFFKYLSEGSKKIYYIGDAAGRGINQSLLHPSEKDFAMTDRKFAANSRMTFFTDEEFFLLGSLNLQEWIKDEEILYLKSRNGEEPRKPDPLISELVQKHPRIIFVLVGIQGSGKTTFAKFAANYFVFSDQGEKAIKLFSADEGTPAKKKAFIRSMNNLAENERGYFMFDATHPSVESRQEYLSIPGFLKVCINFNISPMLSKRNRLIREILHQEKHVPKIAINIFKKKYQIPTVEEGFDHVINVERPPTLPVVGFGPGPTLTSCYINECYLIHD